MQESQRVSHHQASTGPTHIAARSTRTPEQVESNRAFMAAAGRVKFGRFAATERAVFMAFAYFASLGNERICYAAVERNNDDDDDRPAGGGIAERAKVSGRTVRRHIPAIIDRGLIDTENRVGGRLTTVWKVILPDEADNVDRNLRGRTLCPARADTMSDEIRDQRYVPGRAAKLQARPGVQRIKSGSRPVTTTAPLKGSSVPSLIGLASAAEAQPHIDAMRAAIAQRAAKRLPCAGTSFSPPDPSAPSTFTLDPALEARFEEEDRLLHERLAHQPARQPAPPAATGCPACGHDLLMGGSCDQCGHDDGTGFSPSPDYNAGL